jgi:hypothetical protein
MLLCSSLLGIGHFDGLELLKLGEDEESVELNVSSVSPCLNCSIDNDTSVNNQSQHNSENERITDIKLGLEICDQPIPAG